MFFDSWDSILRITVVGTLAYVGLVLILRVSGKRTLGKMNAFDLVITVAFGSILASMILSSDVPLADGLAAFALLVLLQYLVTWTAAHWKTFRSVVKAEPRLLAFRGRTIDDALRSERVTPGEIDAAIRDAGLTGVEDTLAVVLETDGSLSVLPADQDTDPDPRPPSNEISSLERVHGLDDAQKGG